MGEDPDKDGINAYLKKLQEEEDKKANAPVAMNSFAVMSHAEKHKPARKRTKAEKGTIKMQDFLGKTYYATAEEIFGYKPLLEKDHIAVFGTVVL